jgi:hypothetical protein
LNNELGEGQTALVVNDYQSFLYFARIFEFFDYWTRELCIFENMRAIDLVITSSANDLDLWQSSELFLTIARVNDGSAGKSRAIPNKAWGAGWKARFVVPEVGAYRIVVQRRQSTFSKDVSIDQSVIAAGHLEIQLV